MTRGKIYKRFVDEIIPSNCDEEELHEEICRNVASQLPGILPDLLNAISKSTASDFGISFACLFPVLSFLVQEFGNFKISNFLDSPLSIFSIISAPSGEKKTSVSSLLLKPIYRKEASLVEDYKLKSELYSIRLKKFKKSLDVPGFEKFFPKKPIYPSLVISDPTIEGIFLAFSVGRDGLFLFSDEGGAFFSGYSFSSSSMITRSSTKLSNLWNGHSLEKSRSTLGRCILPMQGKKLSICLLMQPEIFYPFVWEKRVFHSQGLLSRFCVYVVRNYSSEKTLSRDLFDSLNARTSSLLQDFYSQAENILNIVHSKDFKPLQRISLDSDAIDLFLDLVEECRVLAVEEFSDIPAFVKKLPEHALRILGSLFLFDRFAQEKSYVSKTVLFSREQLQVAINVAFAFLTFYRFEFSFYKNQKKVLKKVYSALCNAYSLNKNKSVSVTPVRDMLQSKEKRSISHVRECLNVLRSKDLIEIVVGKRGEERYIPVDMFRKEGKKKSRFLFLNDLYSVKDACLQKKNQIKQELS